ncbi:MAG: TatD family hydrolase [Elusimicrobiota bacterium]|jgi:TatD DNase family protein
MFTDTHLHLADSQFGPDREAVMERALAVRVTTLIEIAESPDIWDAAIALADQYPSVYVSLGIHPHYAHQYGAKEWSELEKRFRNLLQHPKAVAIGEFGLDYFRMRNTRDEQAFLFRKQLELAKDLDKPVVIHCREGQRPNVNPPLPPKVGEGKGEGRDVPSSQPSPGTRPGEGANTDIQAAIQEFFPGTSTAIECPRPAGVIHCFSGTWAEAQTYMAHGFLLGIDAPVTYPSAKALQQIVLRMPLERLVLETDAPYLPPQALRGQRNEPANIPVIAETVGTVKHKTMDEVAHRTTQNARQLFRLPPA